MRRTALFMGSHVRLIEDSFRATLTKSMASVPPVAVDDLFLLKDISINTIREGYPPRQYFRIPSGWKNPNVSLTIPKMVVDVCVP